MKVRHLYGAVGLAALPLAGNIASGATIEVIETFDFPGSKVWRRASRSRSSRRQGMAIRRVWPAIRSSDDATN